MTVYYVDTDAAGATAPYDTWAKAAQSLDTIAAVPWVAGDIVYMQGAASDTAATSRTLTAPNTSVNNPVQVKGCIDGTTNAPPVKGDLAVRGTDTLPQYDNTVGGSDLTFAGSSDTYIEYYGIDFDSQDRIQFTGTQQFNRFIGCELRWGGLFFGTGAPAQAEMINCELEWKSGATMVTRTGCDFLIRGGVSTFTASPTDLIDSNTSFGTVTYIAHDLSGFSGTNMCDLGSNTNPQRFINCRFPASYTLLKTGAQPDTPYGSVEAIGCDNAASHSNTTSIPDYEYADGYGIVVSEGTVVRTGGADDGAAGAFSYKMTPTVDSTLEGTYAAIKSPWLSAWTAGGSSTTFKVYTTHDNADSGGADLNEDDLWVEYYTIDAGDTATHDQTFVPAFPANFAPGSSTAAGTDDTTSTWATHNTYKRSFDLTVTPGFEGWIYARVFFAKRYAATPVSVYVDGAIEIS